MLQAEATSKMLKYALKKKKSHAFLFFFLMSKSLFLNARTSQIICVGDLSIFFPHSLLL